MAILALRRCCCRRREEDRRRPKATPLPWRTLSVLSLLVFAGQFGSLMIFPFLPFMVHDFFPLLSRQELGQKAGYLGGAYYLGSFFGSLLWGWVSDTWGRRPVLLCGVCGVIASQLLFGFSQNFAWAVGSRIMWGLLDGTLSVGKTYMSEICDNTNQAQGFSIMATTSGLGRLLGSVAGGFLAQPAMKYSLFQIPFFCQFPYILPCLVGVGIALPSLILSCLFLTETLPKRKGREQNDMETSLPSTSEDSGLEMISQQTASQYNSEIDMDSDTDSLQIAESDVDSSTDLERVASDVELLVHDTTRQRLKVWPEIRNPLPSIATARRQFLGCPMNCLACCLSYRDGCSSREIIGRRLRSGAAKLRSVVLLMRDRSVLISTTLYGLLSFNAMIGTVVFPLLMVTGYEYGGYGLDDSEIGVILMVSAITELTVQLLVYPRVAKCLGYRRTFQLTVTLFGILMALLPLANRITGPLSGSSTSSLVNTSAEDSWWSGSGSGLRLEENLTSEMNASTDYCGNNDTDQLGVHKDSVARVPLDIWITLALLFGSIATLRVNSFTSVIVLVSNSSLPKTGGSVNGIGQALSCVGRAVGPIVGSLLFAWSEGNGLDWPLNYHFTFDVIAVCALLTVAWSMFLPKSIERKKHTMEHSGN